jgi:RsiW-degrading membrane proteinase PrsW (M82 family)
LSLVAALLALAGCSPARALALDEVEIVYELPHDKSLSVEHVRQRLESFRIYADEITLGGELHVFVSRALVSVVDTALTTRGGVKLGRHDGTVLWSGQVSAVSYDKNLVIHFPHTASRLVEDETFVVATSAWGRKLGVVSGRNVDKPVTFPLGDDITEYQRARTMRIRFNTHQLPEIVHKETVASPQPVLGLERTVLPLVISIVWLIFIRRFDRARPEPWWLLFSTFGLSAALTFGAGAIEIAMEHATPYLSPDVMALDGSLRGFPTKLFALLVTVGPVEEGSKLLAVLLLARRRREFDEPVDGLIYAAAAALGFAAAENLIYFEVSDFSIGLISARAMTVAPVHVLLSSFWGYALGRKLVDKKVSLIWWFLASVFAHALYDALAGSIGLFAYVFDVALSVAYVAMLRNALGRSAVKKGDEAPLSERRVSFTVGNRVSFVIACATFVVIEAVIAFARNSTWQHGSFASPIIVVFAVLVVFCGGAVWWVTRALPLDAVVDERGVTYAGDEVRWTEFASLTERTTGSELELVVETKDGHRMRIGPDRIARLAELARMLRARLPAD